MQWRYYFICKLDKVCGGGGAVNFVFYFVTFNINSVILMFHYIVSYFISLF